jgi:hypothetical protein
LNTITCGIDWAEDHHDIALLDGDGRLVAKKRIGESVEGFTELTAMLADAGDTPDAPIPIAIETSRGLLVAALRATGHPIYAITRWPWPATENGTACRARSPTTPMR